MKIYLIFAGLACALLFTACKKDNKPNNNNNNNNLSPDQPKTYIEEIQASSGGTLTTTYNMTYDDQKRLVSMISVSGVNYKQIFNYSANSYTVDSYLDDQPDINEIFWIGANALVDSTLQYNNTNDTSTEKYFYNNAGQRIQLKEYNFHNGVSTLTMITNYTYDNVGNLTSEASSNLTITYEYTDVTYTLNVGQKYFDAPKFFISKMTGNGVSGTHTYTFDDKKRLTKDELDLSDFSKFTKTYIY